MLKKVDITRIADIEKQAALIRACAEQYKYLHKYGLSAVPTRHDTDPRAIAFHMDLGAKQAQKVYGAAYRDAHRDEVNECWRLWYHKHSGEVIERGRPYREEHKVQKADYDRFWRVVNEDRVKANNDHWRSDNPDKVAGYLKSWWDRHPEKMREYAHIRRALIANAEGSFTQVEFRALCEEFGNRCSYCGCSENEVGLLVPDHMIPLSQGGSNSIDNITPACSHCNDSKGSKTFEEYYDWLEARL